jgi:hypothetical protein
MTDGISVKVANIQRSRERILSLASPAQIAKLKAANQQNADEMRTTVARIVPREHGELAATLNTYSLGVVAVATAIGNTETPYPLHLEAGHRNHGGSHTPGKPFWNPAARVQRKRWAQRVRRAGNDIIKSATAGGTSGEGA